MIGGFPNLRKCSGKKPIGSGKVNKGVNQVEIIDLDGEDVIELDDVESLQPQSRASSTLRQNREHEVSGIIDIDDDDDDYYESDGSDSVISVEDLGDLDSDSTSSMSWTFNYRRTSSSLDGDECEVIKEGSFPSKGSKGKQTHSGNSPSRNRYGLYPECETGSSDNDYSDCELIEGSSELFHEYWKKASQKRKHVHKYQFGSGDQASGSGSGSHGDTHVNVEDRTEPHAEAPVCSSPENDDNPPEKGSHGEHLESSTLEPEMRSSSTNFNRKVSEETHVPGTGTESLHVNDDYQHVRSPVTEDPLIYEPQGFHNDGINGETCSSDSAPKFNHDRRSTGVLNEEFLCKNQHSGEAFSDHHAAELGSKGDEFHYAASSFNTSLPKVKLVPGQAVDKRQVDCGSAPSEGNLRAVPRESIVNVHQSEMSERKDISQEKVGADTGQVPICITSCNPSSNQLGINSISGIKSCEAGDQLNAQGGYVNSVQRDIVTVQKSIITDRENLKETAEYKQAMEEEMESRRRVLQIQAEEAQRLRKRKKAENMRLLDMQRRQKQRVDEVRETQKKDEENLNMKEKYRAEIGKELNRLELTCRDMASLLRGLGIPVGAGICPSPQEIHAAYKRAVLKFHPDRASRTEIKQLVEAEEKFKLIARMKEKLVPTSW